MVQAQGQPWARTLLSFCDMTLELRRIAVLALTVAGIGLSATQAAAQATRAEEAAKAREEKARTVEPHRRSAVERLLFKLEDDLLFERLLAPPRGFHLRLGGIGEGSGLAVGPAYRFNAPAFDVKASAAISMKKYAIGEASLRFPGTVGQNAYIRARGPYVELHGRWRDFPQEDFFGLGPDSEATSRSNFALTDKLGRVSGGYVRGQFTGGVGVGYLDVSVGAGQDTRMPSADVTFPIRALPAYGARPSFLIVEPFVEYATLDRARGEKSGGQYRVSAAQYDDRATGRYSFRRWEADLRQYVGFEKDTRSLAIRAWATESTADAGGEVPFYLQPNLGGARSLRGYRSFRFRDRSALLLQAEYRWRVNEFVSGALFYDTGAVAPTLRDLGRLERNYGFGLRAGGRLASAFRLDFAFGGREGRRYLVRFDDAF